MNLEIQFLVILLPILILGLVFAWGILKDKFKKNLKLIFLVIGILLFLLVLIDKIDALLCCERKDEFVFLVILFFLLYFFTGDLLSVFLSRYIGFILGILLTLFISFADRNNIVTILPALIALITLWYGYKKYERSKELEILDKYTKRYNKLLENRDYKGLVDLWYEEYYLYKKGYISDTLWKEWKCYIKYDLYNLLNEFITSNNLSDNTITDNYIDEICNSSNKLSYFVNAANISYIPEFKLHLLDELYNFNNDNKLFKELILKIKNCIIKKSYFKC